MYYYFYSTFDCVLIINGIYYGNISQCIKPIKFDDKTPPFIQVCSLSPHENSVNILLNQEFFTCPPQNVSLVDLNGGYAIIFNSCYKKEGFFVLAQQKFPHAVITVFNENGLKISIETPNDFFALPLKLNADNATITPFSIDSENLIAITLKGKSTHLLIFDIKNDIKCLFFKEVEQFNLDNGLCTTEAFNDIAKHRVTSYWKMEKGYLKEKDRVITQSENFSINKLCPNILPFAFLEQLYCGGNIDEFLSQNIKENAHLFHGFFGKFIGVFPPPAFIDKECVGVIYNVKENVYEVKYFCFEFENNKISNVKKIE